MHVDRQQPPWRVVRAFAQDNGSSLVHLHNVSGGVLSGDHLTLDIDVSPGGSAQVTTTGATRLYRHRQGSAGSEQHTNIRVGEGALLEYLPDALIPYARSRHLQRTSVSLADRATLLWWEIVAPGRQAMGETFAFDCLRLQTDIRSRRGSLLIENIVLEPAVRPLQSPARLGPYSHVANFYAFSVGLPQSRWAELEAEIRDLCTTRSTAGAMIWGLSTLAADGLVVRGLSVSARELPAMLAGIWKITKRSLTGEEAVLPRKVY
jgi:urease accessory protein